MPGYARRRRRLSFRRRRRGSRKRYIHSTRTIGQSVRGRFGRRIAPPRELELIDATRANAIIGHNTGVDDYVLFLNDTQAGDVALPAYRLGKHTVDRFVSINGDLLIHPQAVALTTSWLRVMVVVDHIHSGAGAITIPEVLEAEAVLAHRRISYLKRFHVYYDRVFSVNCQRCSVTIKANMSFKNITAWNGQNAGILNIVRNPIYVLAFAESSDVEHLPFCALNIRMRYHGDYP